MNKDIQESIHKKIKKLALKYETMEYSIIDHEIYEFDNKEDINILTLKVIINKYKGKSFYVINKMCEIYYEDIFKDLSDIDYVIDDICEYRTLAKDAIWVNIESEYTITVTERYLYNNIIKYSILNKLPLIKIGVEEVFHGTLHNIVNNIFTKSELAHIGLWLKIYNRE